MLPSRIPLDRAPCPGPANRRFRSCHAAADKDPVPDLPEHPVTAVPADQSCLLLYTPPCFRFPLHLSQIFPHILIPDFRHPATLKDFPAFQVHCLLPDLLLRLNPLLPTTPDGPAHMPQAQKQVTAPVLKTS